MINYCKKTTIVTATPTVIFVLLFAISSSAQNLRYPTLVEKFYIATNQQLLWLNNTFVSDTMRMILLQKIDSSAYIGIDKRKYNYDRLYEINDQRSKEKNDTTGLMKQDMLFTDAAIAYCKDMYQGNEISTSLMYDEWSGKYAAKDNDFLIAHLANVRSSNELLSLFNSLEPYSKEYLSYKTEFQKQYLRKDYFKANQVTISMNLYRWIHHFNFKKFIVVNIPSTTLGYYENDSEILFSRMVVGKPSTRTPRFSATCREVILYPYWNVPQEIALKELVPKYKKHPALIDEENMQLLNAKGNVIDPASVKWSQFNRHYFPYRLRQSTGCDNSLGIIKLNLTSPFDVYLHDTNAKGLFSSNYRFKSHGCMRVEKAVELGNYLLNNKLDTAFLRECIKGEQPITIPLKSPVPVFAIYQTAQINDSGQVKYYPDIYHLLQKN